MAGKRPPINHGNNRQIRQNAKDISAVEATTLTNATAIALNTAKVTFDKLVAVDANTLKVSYPPADGTKVGYITVNQAVNLDTIESDTATNNAKNTYPSVDATAVATIPAGLSGYEARIAAMEASVQFQPKAFGRFTTVSSPSLYATSYNVTSASKSSTGVYDVLFDTDMASSNYTVIVSCEDATATIQILLTGNIATTGFTVALRDGANVLSDVSESVSFVIFENNT